MGKRSLKVLLLSDLSVPPPEDHDFSKFFGTEEWKSEAQLARTLKSLGHEVRAFGIQDTIEPLVDELRKTKPDLVFNLCEAVRDDRSHEPNVVSLLELMGVPYTGAGSVALQICKDKALTKKILAFHQIRVPLFTLSRVNSPLKNLKNFPYPAFIKPLDLEASEGIAQYSFSEDEKGTLERVKYIHEHFGIDAIIEEYIEGREITVGVLGNKKIRILPAREMCFGEMRADEPRFVTYKAKWDENYRKRWGIHSRPARNISSALEKKINEITRDIYDLFRIKGYARIDFRLTPNGELVFIEANPNPSISKDDDFVLSAEKAGLSYEDLIEQIISGALSAYEQQGL